MKKESAAGSEQALHDSVFALSVRVLPLSGLVSKTQIPGQHRAWVLC